MMPNPEKQTIFCQKYIWTQVASEIDSGYIFSDNGGRFFVDYTGEFVEKDPIRIPEENDRVLVRIKNKSDLFVKPVDSDSYVTLVTEAP